MFENVQSIAEIQMDHHLLPRTISQINAYLKKGWIVLAIHERGYDYTKSGEDAKFITVYILGHSQQDAPKPTREPLSEVWE